MRALIPLHTLVNSVLNSSHISTLTYPHSVSIINALLSLQYVTRISQLVLSKSRMLFVRTFLPVEIFAVLPSEYGVLL